MNSGYVIFHPSVDIWSRPVSIRHWSIWSSCTSSRRGRVPAPRACAQNGPGIVLRRVPVTHPLRWRRVGRPGGHSRLSERTAAACEASLPEAQLVETALLATVLFQTMVATKARRVVDAADGRPVIEFGARRAHGTDAATLAARAAFIGGCTATSQLECGKRFGVPVSGTMAHSWVMTHEREADAFRRYTELYGDDAVLLVDTYDTVSATHTIVTEGLTPAAVRLDSGDLDQLSRDVRHILDAGGREQTQIFVSGDLDEHRVAALVAAGAPIDGFGVGTALSTSQDAPSLSGVYKLVEVVRDGQCLSTAKRSPEKQTLPGRKQVWRVVRDDVADHDVLGTADEAGPDAGLPLLECVMRHGRRIGVAGQLADLQARCRASVRQLPPRVRALHGPPRYDVRVSESLKALVSRI